MIGAQQAESSQKGKDDVQLAQRFLDELLEAGVLSKVQHRLLSISISKWECGWTEEMFSVAATAVVRLHNNGNAKVFVKEAQAALPETHEGVSQLGAKITVMFGEDVATWLAAIFYIMVATIEKPEILDRI
jgi:hypothetical protein